MKILDPNEYITFEIDEAGTRKFEAFLDRNFPDWQEREMLKTKRAGTIQRDWLLVGDDGVERHALYRNQ